MSLCICVKWLISDNQEKRQKYSCSSLVYYILLLSQRSQHPLMCVVLKSNLYDLNESKAPQQNVRCPISTHQLLPLKSLIIRVRLWWLVEILMWCRLPVCLFLLASSQTLAKTLVGKVITHRQLSFRLSKQQGEAAVFRGLHTELCLHQHPSRQCVTSLAHLHWWL